jgi:hypothetical protein
VTECTGPQLCMYSVLDITYVMSRSCSAPWHAGCLAHWPVVHITAHVAQTCGCTCGCTCGPDMWLYMWQDMCVACGCLVVACVPTVIWKECWSGQGCILACWVWQCVGRVRSDWVCQRIIMLLCARGSMGLLRRVCCTHVGLQRTCLRMGSV